MTILPNPAFGDDLGDGWGVELTCPHCGEGYLHHYAVTVYDRKEDGDHTVETTTTAGGITESKIVPSTVSRNPSSRRDGFSIAFWCEHCDPPIELTFAQHKGITLVAWRPGKAAPVKREV